MKLIKGDTLEALLAARPDPADDRGRFVTAFEAICQALAYAHAHDVIHRDLKPANVMVGNFGEVQVMDWGLAKVLTTEETAADPDATSGGTVVVTDRDSDGSFTHAGSVLGTPAFMPPEQAIGAITKINRRSDVFGLGGVLAVILTGKPPFTSSSSETTRVKAATGDVVECFARLDSCGADPELVTLCKRCLSPRQDDRPADAGEVARTVASLREAADERARQAELDKVRAEGDKAAAELRAAEQRRRSRLRLALLATVGLLVLAGVAFAWYADRQATAREQERLENERKESEARATARLNLIAALDRTVNALREDQLPIASASLERSAELLDHANDSDLRQRYVDLRADLTLFVELERVWARASAVRSENSPGGGKRVTQGLRFDEEAARSGYPAAFAARGLPVRSDSPAELTEQIKTSAIRERLISALDDWLPVARPEDKPWLCDLLGKVDPDPARSAIRKAHIDPSQLLEALDLSPPDALRVAARAAMTATGNDPRINFVLEKAAARYPNDFRILYAAGVRASRSETRVEYLRCAVTLRPDNLAAVYALGLFLYQFPNRENEGSAYLLRAVQLDPEFDAAYIALADSIKIGANSQSAVEYFQSEVARNPNRASAHFGLGMVLRDNKPREAQKAFERSIALNDKSAAAHNYLGYVLPRADTDARIRAYRRAIELDPTFSFPHFNLANTLVLQKKLPEAEKEYHESLGLFPEHIFSHESLARLLAQQGRKDEAEWHWRAVLQYFPNFESIYYPLGLYLLLDKKKPAQAVEIFKEYVRRFPDAHVANDGLILSLGRDGRHSAAVQEFANLVSRGIPKSWPSDTVQRTRYNAACSAALAGVGRGKDVRPGGEWIILRLQSLTWLRQNLAKLKVQSQSKDLKIRKAAAETLARWIVDSDFVAVRPGLGRLGMPATERAEWDTLWAEVKATLVLAEKL